MRIFAIFAVLVLVMATGMLSATVVTATAQSRVGHYSSSCTGTGSTSYWEVDNSNGLQLCNSAPKMTCSNPPCRGACVDTIKVSASPSGSFTAPDGSTVSAFYYDPIGQYNNCGTVYCTQNRIAARSSWTPLVYWYSGSCYKWAYALDSRMNPGLNMMVGMSAAGYNGYPGGFYFLDSTGASNTGGIGFRDVTSSSQQNLVNMPIFDLGVAPNGGSWGIGSNNYPPQMFLYMPAGTYNFLKQMTPFITNRGAITGTSFYNPGLTSTTFDVTSASSSKPK